MEPFTEPAPPPAAPPPLPAPPPPPGFVPEGGRLEFQSPSVLRSWFVLFYRKGKATKAEFHLAAAVSGPSHVSQE